MGKLNGIHTFYNQLPPWRLTILPQIQEISIDYSRCSTLATADFTNIPSNLVHTEFKSKNSSSIYQWRVQNIQVPYGNDRAYTLPTNQCTLRFEIPNELGSPIYMYYRLTKFYQNHRRYVKSLNQDQLVGNFVDNSTIGSSDCDPLKLDPSGKAYYPCGLIANSLFNDTIQSPQLVTSNTADVAAGPEAFSMTNQGIAWGSDRNLYKEAPYTADQVVPPPNWRLQYPEGYNDNFPIPDISTWEEFQVWMRTAGLPTFSKMALRSDNQRMPAGVYEMNIYDCMFRSSFKSNHRLLTNSPRRLPSHRIWRYKRNPHLHTQRHRRQERLLGYRIHYRRWSLSHSGRALHGYTYYQTEEDGGSQPFVFWQ